MLTLFKCPRPESTAKDPLETGASNGRIDRKHSNGRRLIAEVNALPHDGRYIPAGMGGGIAVTDVEIRVNQRGFEKMVYGCRIQGNFFASAESLRYVDRLLAGETPSVEVGRLLELHARERGHAVTVNKEIDLRTESLPR